MSTFAFVILLSVAILVGWSWRKKRTSGPQPPTYPGELPIIGHAHQVIGDGTHVWNTAKKVYSYSLQNGGVAVIRTCTMDFYFITDPDDCATVASSCYDKNFAYEFCKPIFGEALFSSKEQVWREDRKLVLPAFGQEKLNHFNEIFNLNAKSFTEELKVEVGKRSLAVWQILLYSIVKGVCGTTLGLESDNAISVHYVDNMEKIVDLIVGRFQQPWLLLDFIHNLSKNKNKQEECVENIRSITSKIIQERKSEIKKAKADVEVKTFLDIMITQGSFTDNQLREHSDLMIVASYDTVHHALTFILLLIGSHQDVQERIYKELQDTFNSSETYVSKHELSKLVYLEAVIKECMRILPAVPMVARHVDKDVKLKNYILPKGSDFIMCIYGMHRHPMWGADAEEFRPERWLEPGGVPENINVYSPFSLGKRNCIGKQYAMNLMKIYLAHFLRKYRVTANIDGVVLKYQAFLAPSSGHELVLHLRE